MDNSAAVHFGQWWAMGIFIVLGLVFLAFTPFYKKSQLKPAGVYIAFIVAWAFEMFGIPMSMYLVTWIVGKQLPDGVLWGHTLYSYFGDTVFNISYLFFGAGLALIIVGWWVIYKRYWSKEAGKGEMVTSGIYSVIRHPQYTGFMLVTLGCLLDWATLPMLIMWPIMAVLYYRLARKEEQDMEIEFGQQYLQYKQRTGMFLPRLIGRPVQQAHTA